MFLASILASALWRVESVFRSAEGSGGGNGPKGLPVYLTTIEVAQMLKMSPRSIEKIRLEGRGPRYFRLGPGGKSKVLYLLDDVLKWVESHQGG